MKVRELRAHADALGFTPQEPVRWLAPAELARTAVKVVIAAVFAGYADKREFQGVLAGELLEAPPGRPEARELWFDFVADLGDGFDATSSVAWALAAEELPVPPTGSGAPGGDAPGPGGPRAGAALGDVPLRLPRGSLLVLGGDEVYPTASAEGYEDRMKGPYRAALPTAQDPPLMVALPGNHDWYDGLTAFLRMFAQQRPIGGWQTRQTRSYFCVRLPERWWLVGLDSQLGTYFDDPQLRYFQENLSAHLLPGDGVIVCSTEPTWLQSAGRRVDAFNSLHWFDRNVVRQHVDRDTGERRPTHATVRLWLTGDRHHYARYAELLPDEPPPTPDSAPGAPVPDPRRRQMVTCGLGGAYLAATHRLPPVLPLPPYGSRLRDRDDPPVEFARMATTYPDAAESRRLTRGIAVPWSGRWLPWRNTGFASLVAGLHAGLFLVSSFLFALSKGVTRPVDAVRGAGIGAFWGFGAVCLGVAGGLLLLGFLGRLLRRRRAAPPSRAAVASLGQVAVALAALAVTMALPFPASWSGWAVLLVCLAVAAGVGAVVGSGVFALWVLTARGGPVAEWQMSGQSIEDHKGFLRLHIAPGGDLTVHPLTLDAVCHDWELADDPTGGRSRHAPEAAAPTARRLVPAKRPVPVHPPTVRLIEEPFVISRGA
ncbi:MULTISPECIES: metallophosphoesterase [unclassified Streptomyces]|uniref:metallophosphoesterase family protein n=1 Tax=unclassified Streptomyces TaxID=2593676 RepID=UPI002E31B7E4|nr:metallophosphoesterase [Streptomyces sp. NBC_01268]